jgi:hypothetical protein
LKIQKKEKERENTWGNALLINPIMKVQEPNIEGLTSFRKRESERKRRKKKRRKKATYSQQTWRRSNHVKTQGWSPCGLPIHVFLIFKSHLIFLNLFQYYDIF